MGAGVGRTGTESLKLALERLLGGTCHHMREAFARPEQFEVFRAAAEGDPPDWATFLADYTATTDFPSASFYAELSEAFLNAVVVLSTRASAEEWWRSANATIFPSMRDFRDAEPASAPARQLAMMTAIFDAKHHPDWLYLDAEDAMAVYERHNAEVRASVPAERLVEHQPGDGWAPICERLGVPVPDGPFPHTNTTAEFTARAAEARRSRSST